MTRLPSGVTLTCSWPSPGSKIPDPCASFIQKSVGSGFPAARQSNLTEEPLTSLLSPGLTTNTGGAAMK